MTYAVLDARSLAELLGELQAVGAHVEHEADDYGNPVVTITTADQRPVLVRQSVIGGEVIVGITVQGDMLKLPAPNGDPFGPITADPAAIESAWTSVVAVYPDAAVS